MQQVQKFVLNYIWPVMQFVVGWVLIYCLLVPLCPPLIFVVDSLQTTFLSWLGF